MCRPNFFYRAGLFVVVLLWGLGFAAPATASKADNSPAKQLGLIEYSTTEYLEKFTLTDLRGNAVSSKDFSGQVVLLNFWATWCHQCENERSALQAVSNAFRDQGLAVVAISANPKGKERVPPYVEKHNLTFLHLLDEKRVLLKQLSVHALPTSFVVGRDGRLLSKGIGGKAWDSEIGRLYLMQVLNEVPAE